MQADEADEIDRGFGSYAMRFGPEFATEFAIEVANEEEERRAW
jgi:hypothetical protein